MIKPHLQLVSQHSASLGIILATALVATAATGDLIDLSYSPGRAFGRVDYAIPRLAPTVTGTADTYSIDPALPEGLTINPTTGEISGTPSAFSTGLYTVTASNASGSTKTTVTISVIIPPVDALPSYVKSFGLNGPDASATADPDLDGLDNTTEFVFGTDPSKGGSRATTQGNLANGTSVGWLQRSGVTYSVKSTADLKDGFRDSLTPARVVPRPSGLPAGYEQYAARLTNGASGFLKVEGLPFRSTDVGQLTVSDSIRGAQAPRGSPWARMATSGAPWRQRTRSRASPPTVSSPNSRFRRPQPIRRASVQVRMGPCGSPSIPARRSAGSRWRA